MRLFLFVVTLWASSVSAATIHVTTNVDEFNADGDCSLREAVAAANTNAAADACTAGSASRDEIRLMAIAGQTIALTLGQIEVAGGLTLFGSSVTIDANEGGRIFRIDVGGAPERVSLSDLTLRDGSSAGGGGAVLATDGGQTGFARVTFDSNTSAGPGGALRVGTGVHLLSECVFTGNSTTAGGAAEGGGALFNSGGEVDVTHSAFSNNTAVVGDASGGAILNGFGGTLVVRILNGFAENRAARNGGAIETAGTLTVQAGAFTANSAGVNGGAVHVSGTATAALAKTSDKRLIFDRNTAGMEGGALWNSSTGTLTVDGAEILNNTAAGPGTDQGGGGVFSDGGVTVLRDAVVSGNDATGAAGSGGGVLNTAAGRMTLLRTTISGNTAVRAGGGVENTATAGAAENHLYMADVDVSGNTAVSAPGGGVHVSGGGVVTVVRGRVAGNRAVEGGGLWNSAEGTLTVTGAVIADNTATGAEQGGGGLFSDGGGGMTITDATITGNDAAGAGGGLFNNTGAATTVTGTTISGNTAQRSGGGIENQDGASLTLSDVTLSGNAVASLGDGGGLHMAGAGTVRIDASRVTDNVAGGEGGGLWNSAAGTVTVVATEVARNRAVAGSGGGLYQVRGAGGTLTVERCLLVANRAAGGGGGLFAAGGNVHIVNSTISENESWGGGGVAITQGGRVRLESVTVVRNTAATPSGGLYSQATAADALRVRNTIVARNVATGFPSDLYGPVVSEGHNLFETVAGGTVTAQPSDLVGVDPRLGPLAYNGGPTLTHALDAGSPAVEAGATSFAVDQRGFQRTATPSIGAFEFGGTPVAGEAGPADPLPALVTLSVATPNPVRFETTLRFTTAADGLAEVALFDALGRRVRTLYSGTPGPEMPVEVVIDAAELAPGVYVVRLNSGAATATRRLTVVR